VNLLSTLLLIMAHRFFFQCQIILCSCLTIGLFFFAYAAPSSSSFQSILDDETVDYPMGVRQSATILFPDSVGNRSEKASSSTVGGNCKKTCMLLITLSIISLTVFSSTEKEIDTGSIEDEKQESLDDLPNHLKIGKEFTMRVTILQAYGLASEYSDIFTQFK
jgi:kinesin family protein 1